MAITLPTVLAGPIVRRVEPRLVAIWIALKDAVTASGDSVQVKIWRGFQMSGPAAGAVVAGDPVVGTGSATTRSFGQHLHIALVVVKIADPRPALDPGTVYSYDVVIKRGGDTQNLKTLGFLTDQPAPPPPADTPPALALGYATDRLPTFCTPPASIDKVRLTHGSCRRSNAPGFDALAFLDDTLADSLANPDERPQQLILTGDQIYADDMGAGMLTMVHRIGEAVMGAPENLRVNGTPLPVTLTNFPAERRLKFVNDTASFTTSDGKNHLLSFGEFAGMYLASWNPRIWSALGQPSEMFVAFAGDEKLRALVSYPEGGFTKEQDAFKPMTGPDGQQHPVFGAPGTNAAHVAKAIQDWAANRTAEHGSFTEEQTNTILFRHGVPRVARALANIATYMICDDHEVTDDWNLNQKWRNRVYSNTAGKDIVRNGVAAFGVFQGWGNDPTKFEPAGNNKDFLDTTSALFTGAGPYPTGSLDRIEELTAVSGAPLTKQPAWHFQIAAPRHVIAVMDSRTRRKFTGQAYEPPDLIGNNRDEQIPKGPFTDEHELLFIVAPAPVFGPDVIESLGWPLAVMLTDLKIKNGLSQAGPVKREVGSEKFDAEGWASNPQAREDLLKRVATFPRAVFLSGDVHYGCSLTVDYWKKASTTPVRIVQLTSSGTRNNFKPIVAALVRTNAMLQSILTEFSAEQLAWDAPPPISLPAGAFVSPGRLARLGRSPALVPAAGWPTGTTLPTTAAPDWSWRAAMVRDNRPDTALPTARRPLSLSPTQELVATAALPTYRALAARHAQAAATNFDHRRQIVFVPNIGLVKLWKKGTELMVTHTLMTAETPEAITGSANTVHDISLAPTMDAAPTILTRDA